MPTSTVTTLSYRTEASLSYQKSSVNKQNKQQKKISDFKTKMTQIRNNGEGEVIRGKSVKGGTFHFVWYGSEECHSDFVSQLAALQTTWMSRNRPVALFVHHLLLDCSCT